ncbi:methyl-accepting chemotaxis protein [Dethiosulfatarculus sandiegensis]|uniref:Methyl-accepting chemotaxis protein n=1 Tax=Dethiosulfatarculus sandiegensis TaxID=1429043 RepID=A0A0D2JA24_9BACT|nr:methyl-accepting chemotaxis protein [Dethiosulfatarculus sandiegensis]KIX14994.1 methyl-accepting chemotaxis protein [Dethiosulfatarculus sandiegensis]
MKTNLKLGTKIAGSFALLILVFLGISGVTVYYLNQIKDESQKLAEYYLPSMSRAIEVENNLQEAFLAIRNYTFTMDSKYLVQGNAALDKTEKSLKTAQDSFSRFARLNELQSNGKKAAAALADFKKLLLETKSSNQAIAKGRKDQDIAQKVFVAKCLEYRNLQISELHKLIASLANEESMLARLSKITTLNDMIDQANAARVASYRAQSLRDPQLMQEVLASFDGLINMDQLLLSQANGRNEEQLVKSMIKGLNQYIAAVKVVVKGLEDIQQQDQARVPLEARLLNLARYGSTQGIQKAAKMAHNSDNSLESINNMAWISLACLLIFAVLLTTAITLAVTKPIQRVINGLNNGSDEVAQAAYQVSEASQTLAEGSGQQAASLEETAASLEEMASMTKQNADHAEQADLMMKEAGKVVDQAIQSMGQLKTAMDTIDTASSETSKIIKTIDEISFQTNLLALNAAVEAARAGEAGAGFAVVADEVRNLAMRAAEAARNTATLIDENLTNIAQGAELVKKTDKVLAGVEHHAGSVGGLISEISAASQEQAQGIDQVNRATTEMDKVTQQNSSGAEESAAAAEQMRSQADDLKMLILDLENLVKGGKNASQKFSQPKAEKPVVPARAKIIKGQTQKQTALPEKTGTSLPLDDDEFFADSE